VLCSGKVYYDLIQARGGSPTGAKGVTRGSSPTRGPQTGSPAGVGAVKEGVARGSSPTVREGANEEDRHVAIIRLEQFYPYPATLLKELIASYANATELVWAQEEPQNMGGWTFMESRLERLLPRCE